QLGNLRLRAAGLREGALIQAPLGALRRQASLSFSHQWEKEAGRQRCAFLLPLAGEALPPAQRTPSPTGGRRIRRLGSLLPSRSWMGAPYSPTKKAAPKGGLPVRRRSARLSRRCRA